jgi:ribosome-associated translation inhibitor RaiA
MKLLLNAFNVSAPALETIEFYSLKRFQKLNKVIPKAGAESKPLLKVDASYNRRKKVFTVKIILSVQKQQFVFEIYDRDVRRAIDVAASAIRQQILKKKGKKWLNNH